MTGIQSFVNNDLPALGWSPAMVIVGEPTEHVPVIAHNGCLRWAIETTGTAVHSSTPWEGHSAISDMLHVLSLLQRAYIDKLDTEHPLTGRAAVSVNVIEGGHAPNIIPDYCMCEIDRRLVPGEDPKEVIDHVSRLIDTLKPDHPKMQVSLSLRIAHPPLLPGSSEAVLPIIKQALKDNGLKKPAIGAPFATHAGYLSHAGLPTVVLGPGSAHPAHTKDEWVSVQEIELGVKVYASLMRSDCQSIASKPETLHR